MRYIDKVIDNEIKKSLKFGLKIMDCDILKEKAVINIVFDYLYDIIKNSNHFDYSPIRKIAMDVIFEELKDTIKYYYDLTINDDVRNKYNCHLTNIIDNLFIGISNNLEAKVRK